MRKLAGFVSIFGLALLAGCSSTPSCLEHQSYMDARAFPPLQSPPGLDVPEPEPSMEVPEVSSGPVGYFDEAPANRSEDDPAARCLITPPAMA